MCVFWGVTVAATKGIIHNTDFVHVYIYTILLAFTFSIEPINQLSLNTPLMMNRHRHIRLRSQRILLLPQTRHRLLLRIKVQSNLSIKRIRAPSRNTLLVPREREVRHADRDGDGHVDADLAALDVLLEGLRGGAGLGEDGHAVAVFVGVDEVDGAGEGGDFEGDEDGAEDLFGVALHVWLDACDDGGADPVACFC